MASHDDGRTTFLIGDDPEHSDSFGTHEPVADAICDLISRESGGVSIALEGSWGAGKSTIVNIARAKLESSSSRTAVIVFDAWAHQGDPLRRSFLERLIDELVKRRGWATDKDHWADVEDELANRLKKENRTQTPIIEFWGFIFALLALLAPAGLVIAKWSLDESNTPWINLGFGMILSPLFLALVLGLVTGTKWAINKLWHREVEQEPFLQQLSSLVLAQTTTRVDSETRETPQPTSVEFASHFARLMCDSLNSEERKVVLVLDNLDRVTPDDAKAILSTMQAFIQNPEYAKKEWFKRIYVLIPFDPDGFSQLWRAKTKEDEVSLAQRFIEKTFQIRFLAPPISLSNWGKYLETLLTQAFPDLASQGSEFHRVYRVFDLNRKPDDLPPTPRELKLFVNQIGALRRQKIHDLPLSHLAYYALLTSNGKPPISDIRSGEVPSERMKNLLGRSLVNSLAALSFNTDPETATEFLLQPEISRALADADGDKLREIVEKHPSGAWRVIERVPFDEWSGSERSSLPSAATALLQAGIGESAPAHEADQIIEHLASEIKKTDNWSQIGEALGAGLGDILTLRPDPSLLGTALSSVAASVSPGTEPEGEVESLRLWQETISPIIAAAEATGLNEHLHQGILVPGPATWYLNTYVVFVRSESLRGHAPSLRTEANGEQVTKAMVDRVESGQFGSSLVGAIGQITNAIEGIAWESVAGAAADRLGAIDRKLLPKQSSSLVELLWSLAKDTPKSEDRLVALAGNNTTLHYLYQADTQGAQQEAAWFLLTHIHKRPNPQVPEGPTGNMKEGWDLLQRIAKSPSEHPEYLASYVQLAERTGEQPRLLEIANATPQWRAWCVAAMSKSIEAGDTVALVDSAAFISNFAFLKKNLDIRPFEQLIGALVEKSGLTEEIMGQNFDPHESQLHHDVLECGGSNIDAYVQWLSDGLKDLRTEDWDAALTEESPLLDLLVARESLGGGFALDIQYCDAVRNLADRTISSSQVPSHKAITSREFLRVVSGADRSALRSRFLVSARGAHGALADAFFDIFGNDILEDLGIVSNDQQVVQEVFDPLVEHGNRRGIEWLSEVFEKEPELLKAYKPAYAISSFRERVESELEANPEAQDAETRAALERLGKALGIEYTKPTVDGETDDTVAES